MRITLLTIALIVMLAADGQAQDEDLCGADALTRQQGAFAAYLSFDFADDAEQSLANLFRLGALYQTLALDCGYQPNEVEIDRLLEQTLRFVSLEDLILAQAVGADVDAILLELDEVYGDPLKGQLLYNGLAPALGGSALGCAGCHENEAVAPLTAGTWTRVDEIRLALPAFADYSHRRFLVESIVQPMVYITPDYAGMMPEIYGRQLTTQQLADLVGFLESQDQLLGSP